MFGQTNMLPDTLKKQRTYLFYYGNECKLITGGWVNNVCYYSGYTNDGNITIVNNYINMANNTSNTVPVLATVNRINFSAYKTLCIKYYCTTYNSYNYIRWGLSTAANIAGTEISGAGLQLNTLTTYAYDISNINDERYCYFMNHGAGARSVGKIYEVYLL